ncbi:hypothetical protein COT47_04285, partial [Candidatus Woesearchaeota archaeon CG08_land_8_20_14_0_20_43_7]
MKKLLIYCLPSFITSYLYLIMAFSLRYFIHKSFLNVWYTDLYMMISRRDNMTYNRFKRFIVSIIPGFMIRFLARPYVAGYCMEDAIEQARLFDEKGILSTIDILGEDAKKESDITLALERYKGLIDAVASEFKDNKPTISMKPSNLAVGRETQKGLLIDKKKCMRNVEALIKYADKKRVEMSLDMENHFWTDLTLDIYEILLKKGYTNTGAVLQSRLFRTEKDIKRFKNLKGRFRSCIGIYNEPEDIALQKKPLMKVEMFRHVNQLLHAGHYVEIATHDKRLLADIFDDLLTAKKIPSSRFEVQMLMGVPRRLLQGKIMIGRFRSYIKPVRMRLYVPFAYSRKDATAYCRRRLMANPDIVDFGAKNF